MLILTVYIHFDKDKFTSWIGPELAKRDEHYLSLNQHKLLIPAKHLHILTFRLPFGGHGIPWKILNIGPQVFLVSAVLSPPFCSGLWGDPAPPGYDLPWCSAAAHSRAHRASPWITLNSEVQTPCVGPCLQLVQGLFDEEEKTLSSRRHNTQGK